MDRRGWIALLTAVSWLAMAAGASAKEGVQSIDVSYQNISIQVDGKAVQTASEPFIVVSEGRTYVPARALAEALGAKVGWDPNAHAVTVFTQRYVKTATAGGVTTYSLPYWGVRLKLPAGGTVQNASGGLVLEVADETAGRFTMLYRFDASSIIGTGTIVDAITKVFQTVLPGLTFGSPKSITVPGAVSASEAVGSATSLGKPVTFRLREIDDGTSVWGLGVMYGTSAQNASWADQVLGSFQLPSHQGASQ